MVRTEILHKNYTEIIVQGWKRRKKREGKKKKEMKRKKEREKICRPVLAAK